jgi:hypothetical protein
MDAKSMVDRISVPLLMCGWGIVAVWFLVAPRDPGGRLCDATSPLRTIAAILRGQVETGCSWHDEPINERPLWDVPHAR